MGRGGGCQEWDNCYKLEIDLFAPLNLQLGHRREFFVTETDSVADTL